MRYSRANAAARPRALQRQREGASAPTSPRDILWFQQMVGNRAVADYVRGSCVLAEPVAGEAEAVPALLEEGPAPPPPSAAVASATAAAPAKAAATGATPAPAATDTDVGAWVDSKTKVVGHGASAAAIAAAKNAMQGVLRKLAPARVKDLVETTIELHVIPHDKKLTDLPEYASLKGKRTFDGRLYDEIRGAGGQRVDAKTIRYAIAEEEVVKIKGKASSYGTGFVAAHETGHVVRSFYLSKEQIDENKRCFEARTKAGGPWLEPVWYTSSREDEYFAQATAAYFGFPYSTSDADKKSYTKAWLQKNDPGIHKLLSEVFP
jgi:hypothetical protein